MILELHVQPGAARSEFAGAAPPVQGKANAALVEFLAGYFHKSRRQRVVIEGAQWKTRNAA